MKLNLKTREKTIILIVLSFLAIYYFLFSYRIHFSGIVSKEIQNEVTKIQLRVGNNGFLYTASSKEEIDGFWKVLNKYEYRRDLFSPLVSGYLYSGVGYKDEKQIINLSISDGLWIEDKKYKPSNSEIYNEIRDYVEHGGFRKEEN